jgi:hypothetical protein
VISSSATRRAVAPSLDALLGALRVAPPAPAPLGRRDIDDRLRSRLPSATKPVFVGLLDPNMQSGVVINSIPSVKYVDTLGFVIQQLKKSPHDTTLVEYVMTLVFQESRARDDFESRFTVFLPDFLLPFGRLNSCDRAR